MGQINTEELEQMAADASRGERCSAAKKVLEAIRDSPDTSHRQEPWRAISLSNPRCSFYPPQVRFILTNEKDSLNVLLDFFIDKLYNHSILFTAPKNVKRETQIKYRRDKMAAWYFLIYAIVAAWVFFDAKKRGNNAPAWAAATFILGVIIAPYYLAKRYLLAGETREGGVAWNILRYFALFWTLTMILAAIGGIGAISSSAPTHGNEYEQAGYAIGATIGIGMILTLWFIVLVAALVLGMFLKKSSIVEKGPTGPLAASSKIESTQSETASNPTIESTPSKDESVPPKDEQNGTN